jgi:predicted XRE-type DNA-binding protein
MKKRTHNEHGPRHVTPAERSVFYDLGFDEAEAHVLEMRADLMAALREHIQKRGWTQSEAAKELGVTQPRISALMKGAWRDSVSESDQPISARVRRVWKDTCNEVGLTTPRLSEQALQKTGAPPREVIPLCDNQPAASLAVRTAALKIPHDPVVRH